MPTIHLEKCIQCLKCVKDCPSNAIDIENGTINNTCIHCGHCVAICPEDAVSPDLGTIKSLEESTITSDGFRNLSAGIRSCRSYFKKPVSEETIQALIENMKHYPSASNTRPVQITVVQTAENVQKLNDQTTNSLIKTLKLVTNPAIRPIVKILAPSLKVDSLKKYKDQFIERQESNTSQVCHHAPVVMLFHGPASKLGMAKTDADIWATYTSIYANTMGLGTCFIGFIVKAMENNKTMRKDFNIPAGNQVYATLTLGYPKNKYCNETSRAEPESISV
ncbi:MAG: nitroreductase family protein [Bacteroidetes bacterium]|nr:nitroreductase family protein [Bacteroidota bacterium]